MNREILEASVYLNTYDDRTQGFKRLNKKGKKVEDIPIRSVWGFNRQIIDSGIPVTEEYKNKIRAFYALELNRRQRIRHKEEYDKIMNIPTDDSYYFRKTNEFLEKYRFMKDYKDASVSAINELQEEEGIVQAAVVQEEENIINQEIQQLEADVAVQVAAEENEEPGLTPFEALRDDLNQLYLDRGYSLQQINEIDQYFRNQTTNFILEFIRFARNSSKPVDLVKFINRADVAVQAVPEQNIEGIAGMFDQAEANAEIAAANQVVEPIVPEDGIVTIDAPTQQVTEIQQASIEGTTDNKTLYVERYHPTAILRFFQNNNSPQWDNILESNIMSLDITSQERINIMEDTIEVYGKIINIKKRKTDTLKELNELEQLKFCVLRNLHLGDRARTATIKLSELSNLSNAANSTTMSQASPPTNNLPTIINNVSNNGGTIDQTKQESSFIKNYDRLMHLKNLRGSNYYPQGNYSGLIKTNNDPHTLGIVKGNNLSSVYEGKKTRTITKKKLERPKNF